MEPIETKENLMKKFTSPKKRFAEILRPGDKVALHSRAEGNRLRTLVNVYEAYPDSDAPWSRLKMGIPSHNSSLIQPQSS